MKSPWVEGIAAVLELTATEHPDLLDFQVEVLLHSAMGFTIRELASVFEVPWERVGVTVYQACLHLDQLERRRAWQNPGDVVESPNVAALCQVCRARVARLQGLSRRRRLEAILGKLEKAHDRARSEAWLTAFIAEALDRQEAARGSR